MRHSREFIAEVRRTADLLELAREATSLVRRGDRYYGRCPFHEERTPSFSLDSEAKLFFCHGCGAGGDILSFYRKLHNLSFPEALAQLARRYGLDLPQATPRPASRDLPILEAACKIFEDQLSRSAEAQDYLFARRKLTSATLAAFRVGYAPRHGALLAALRPLYPDLQLEQAGLIRQSATGPVERFRDRIIFPLLHSEGDITGFLGRSLDGTSQPKYLLTKVPRREILFGLLQALSAIRKTGAVYVVEGPFDLLAVHQAGVTQAVASLGAVLTEQQVQLLAQFAQTVILVPDADVPGLAASQRNLLSLLSADLEVQLVRLPGSHDPSSLLAEAGEAALRSALSEPADPLKTQLQGFQSATDPLLFAGQVRTSLKLLAAIADPVKRLAYARLAAETLALPLPDLLALLPAPSEASKTVSWGTQARASGPRRLPPSPRGFPSASSSPGLSS